MSRSLRAGRGRRLAAVRGLAAAVALGLAATGSLAASVPALAQSGPATSPELSVEVLSGRADTVTGGDALVRVNVPRNVPMHKVVVTLNGRDVTDTFRPDNTFRTLTGVVSGLRVGTNAIGADSNGLGHGRPETELTLVNHPAEGPVFSGPHQTPYVCETQSFNVPSYGRVLGPALDANCSVDTRVDYFYRTMANTFRAWPAGATAYPSDLVKTTTTLGTTVPYIVRMETGTLNRSIYQTTILHDPISEPAPNWHTRPAGWNGRLIYTFGGGCIQGWYRQGASTGGVNDDFMLKNGYAVASASLNVFGNNCSDLTAAETMMMVKERFIESYGPVRHTQGFGCSGGSYQQHQIADNYPGLLDGIIPGCSFPEVGFATINFITDAWLLDHYFQAGASTEWTAEQKRLVTGFMVYNTAPNVAVGARRIDPRGDIQGRCGVVPAADIYDPVDNPDGVRCDVYDHTVNVYGTDAATGFARRPLDNTGIQYGLKVLNAGQISVEQFLDLNAAIGGFDHDANIRRERSVADLPAARAAYQTGRLTNGGGGLKEIPIIDHRGYNDHVPGGDIHVRYHSFSMRKRLEKANGTSANQVMLVEGNEFGLYDTRKPLVQKAILELDRWITGISEDSAAGSKLDKVVRNRPATLQEGCAAGDGSFIAQPQVRDPSTRCEQLYPSNSFPREVAGADIAADIIKCQLKPLDTSDYSVAFGAEQWARLEAIFPGGVCDWSKPGVEQQGLAGTWITFGN
jgi:hypothetical protein